MATQELTYKFKVDDEGNIKIINRKQFITDMKAMFGGGEAIGVFRKARKQRSTLANSFYWAVYIPEVMEGLVQMGYDRYQLNREVVHDMLRHKFLTVELPSPDYSGEFITITKSTSELTSAEFSDYMVDIQRWSNEFLGIVLSEPNTQKEMDFI